MLALKIVFITTIVFLCILVLLFIFMIYSKLARNYRKKIHDGYVREIKENLDSLLDELGLSGGDSLNEWDFLKKTASTKPHSMAFLLALETVFLEYMEDPTMSHKLLKIAYALKFPEASLLSIASCCRRAKIYLPNNMIFSNSALELSAYKLRRGESNLAGIAAGCRNVGLYKYKEAIPYMLSALEIMSGETQFQILAGLSRIGDIDSFMQAFEIIKGRVLINERAIFEIISTFNGDKYELHRRMLAFESKYVAAIFMKAMTKEIATALMEVLVYLMEADDKEMTAAAVRALGKTADPKAGKYIARALENPAWEVRAAAAKALGACVCPEAGEALSRALRDREWWVRQNAAATLLSYTDCEEHFMKAVMTGDTYATESIIHTLEGADMHQMLSRIQKAATNKAERLPLFGQEDPNDQLMGVM